MMCDHMERERGNTWRGTKVPHPADSTKARKYMRSLWVIQLRHPSQAQRQPSQTTEQIIRKPQIIPYFHPELQSAIHHHYQVL